MIDTFDSGSFGADPFIDDFVLSAMPVATAEERVPSPPPPFSVAASSLLLIVGFDTGCSIGITEFTCEGDFAS